MSPKWIPQMADTAEVLAGLHRAPGVSYPVLVPNMKGFEGARGGALRRDRGIRRGVRKLLPPQHQLLDRRELRALRARSREAARAKNIRVRGYISTVVDCPYEGPIAPAAVADVAARLWRFGCYEISLGDTIGTGTPARIQAMIDAVAATRSGDKTRRPLPRHLRAGAGEYPGVARSAASRRSTVRLRAWAAVLTRRAPPATSRARTCSICSMGSASRPESISRSSRRPDGSSRRRSAASRASKVARALAAKAAVTEK